MLNYNLTISIIQSSFIKFHLKYTFIYTQFKFHLKYIYLYSIKTQETREDSSLQFVLCTGLRCVTYHVTLTSHWSRVIT